MSKKSYNKEEEKAVKKFCELLEIVHSSPGSGKKVDIWSIEYQNWRKEVILIEQYRQYLRYIKLKGRNESATQLSKGERIKLDCWERTVICLFTNPYLF